jgi:branched-chain amino acid aminotransferase
MLFCDASGKISDQPPQVSFLDHGFLFGDSIYEVVKLYGGKRFGWDEHIERLEKSAIRLGIDLTEIRKILEPRAIELWKTFNNPEGVLRMIVTRGPGKLHIDSMECHDPQLFLAVWAMPEVSDLTELRLMIPKIRRNHISTTDPAIKSGNYLNNVLAFREARLANYDDAMFLNAHDELSELTTSNVGWIRGGKVVTPSTDCGILHGVTRGFFMDMTEVEEGHFPESEVNEAEEFFALSTLKEVMPVKEVRMTDGSIRKFENSPRSLELRAEFGHIIKTYLEKQERIVS